MKHRIFTFNQSCTGAGKVLTDSDMETFHNHTFEGDDYPDDVQLHEGTTEELTEWAKYAIKMRSAPVNSNNVFNGKVAQNILDAVNQTASEHCTPNKS